MGLKREEEYPTTKVEPIRSNLYNKGYLILVVKEDEGF